MRKVLFSWKDFGCVTRLRHLTGDLAITPPKLDWSLVPADPIRLLVRGFDPVFQVAKTLQSQSKTGKILQTLLGAFIGLKAGDANC